MARNQTIMGGRAWKCRKRRDSPLPCPCEPCEQRRIKMRASNKERTARYRERCNATELGAALLREQTQERMRINRERRQARANALFAALRAKAIHERRSEIAKRAHQTRLANGTAFTSKP